MDLTLVTKPGPKGEPIDTSGLVAKHIDKKLRKMERRLGGKVLVVRAVLEQLSVGYTATLTIMGRNEVVGRSKERELLQAVDSALDKLSRQVEARQDKRSGKERARRRSSSGIERVG